MRIVAKIGNCLVRLQPSTFRVNEAIFRIWLFDLPKWRSWLVRTQTGSK
jgi:hypothetical protein